MASLGFIVFYFSVLSFCSLHTSVAPYTLTQSQSLNDGQTLLSRGGSFKLGFFSPSSTSRSRYLGIWYNTIPDQTVVWVANRDAPLLDASGVLKITPNGNLVIENRTTERILWSANASRSTENPILEFLESGNLVLRDSKDGYLWQSFDYPGNTLLSGMKLGWSLETKLNRYLSSWKDLDDPSHGDFTFGMELDGNPEFVMRKGPRKYYRGGSWNGIQETGSPELKPSEKFTYNFTHTDKEIYFMYQLVDPSIIWRLVLTQSNGEGHLQRITWVDRTQSWALEVSEPRDRCDAYRLCGVYSSCDMRDVEVCQCMRGFKPKSPKDWSNSDWSQGCERKVSVNCSGGEGFVKFTEIKLPETTSSWVNASMNLEECRVKCLGNCSCMAYANSDVRRGGSGCILWFDDLVDMRHMSGAGQDLHVRMAASELDTEADSRTSDQVMLAVSISAVAAVIFLCLGIYCIWKKRNLKDGSKRDEVELPLYSKRDELELHLYDLAVLKCATNNFSIENKLGEGGFGTVYKGILEGGEEIAVKRLSKDSVQGVDEFKNEVILISKLQHRNLVKIIGCCLQGDEKMLVYEYLQNKSLDAFIFDNSKAQLLDWSKRFQIILGIARGLQYLHHDSRLRIIHRDLKASNVLLDTDMVPKISDFGMARIFGGDQTEAITKRVVGTHGYISPEYVLDGRFSVKSDVYSFGVIVLEIISGRRNRGNFHPDQELNLLGHAWKLWNEDKASELVPESMSRSCLLEEVSHCVHIALLCVQQRPEQRPDMLSVVFMLNSETVILPDPQPPIFYRERSTPSVEKSSYSDHELCGSNEASMTLLEAR